MLSQKKVKKEKKLLGLFSGRAFSTQDLVVNLDKIEVLEFVFHAAAQAAYPRPGNPQRSGNVLDRMLSNPARMKRLITAGRYSRTQFFKHS